MLQYPVTYQDQHGMINTHFLSDGSTLQIKLRGLTFQGTSFDALEGPVNEQLFNYDHFNPPVSTALLTDCRFELSLPIQLLHRQEQREQTLLAKIQVGKSWEGEAVSAIILQLQLDEQLITAKDQDGFFETALIHLQQKLPDDISLNCCLSCRHSHYFPGGNGMFGDLICFRNAQNELASIHDKSSLLEVLEKHQKTATLFEVQETFLCASFQNIRPGDWCYKGWPGA